MSAAEFFLPKSADKDPRFDIALRQMVADEEEPTNHALHVRNDIRRFQATVDLHKAQFDSSQQNKTWLILIAAFLTFTQFDKVIAFVKMFF